MLTPLLPTETATRHLSVDVDGLSVFDREAGNPDNPTLVLLHGFPSSSHMFRALIPALADEHHVIAPDHIGFGRSAMPGITDFEYSFHKLTEVTLALLNQLGIDRFSLYMHDYGAPIGLRIASRHPDRVRSLISQSGNAYVEGFTPFWDTLFAYADDRRTHESRVRRLLRPERTRLQHTHGVPASRLSRIAPEAWLFDQLLLDRPGNHEIQLQLFWDYQFNFDLYPMFQSYLRTHQPPTLIAWGRNDEIFGEAGAQAYRRDLPNAEIHLLDGGHFALETHGGEIAVLIREFLRQK